MDNIKMLEELYRKEVNWELSCFWGIGYIAKLGDKRNGFMYGDMFDSLDDAIIWLYNLAMSQICIGELSLDR